MFNRHYVFDLQTSLLRENVDLSSCILDKKNWTQVSAVVVYEEARLEAKMESSACNGSQMMLRMDEEIFIAQLHRRFVRGTLLISYTYTINVKH